MNFIEGDLLVNKGSQRVAQFTGQFEGRLIFSDVVGCSHQKMQLLPSEVKDMVEHHGWRRYIPSPHEQHNW